VERGLGPHLRGVDRVRATDDVVVDAVLGKTAPGRRPPEARRVRLVVTDERRVVAVTGEEHPTDDGVVGDDVLVLDVQ
jgi:hypothetical protein